MRKPQSEFGNNVLIIVGVSIIVLTVTLHWALPERFEKVEILPLIVGCGLAYFGALWKDPKRAKEAGDAVVSAGDHVVDSVTKLRTGKRSTDPVVEVEKSHPVDDPTAEPTIKASVIVPGTPSTDQPPKEE